MWVIIFSGCVVPLVLGIFWPDFRPWVIYLVLLVGFLIALIPINNRLNAKNDPEGAYLKGDYKLLVTPHGFRQLTGPYSWRFFNWGMVKGYGANTPFSMTLMYLGLAPSESLKYDITNPTPFHLSLWLLFLGLFTFFAKNEPKNKRKDKRLTSEKISERNETINKHKNKVLCKGCSIPLGQAQINYKLGNPKYNEWCREGFCSLACFDQYQNEKSKDEL